MTQSCTEQNGALIANTAIATNRKFKSQTGEQKEEVMFVDITFFGRTAEMAQQYLHRGSKILVEGRLKFDQWVDQNGQKRSKHGVTVDVMQMLDSKGTAHAENTNIQNSAKQQNIYQPNAQVAPKQQVHNTSTDIDEQVMSEIDALDDPFPF